jgi:hypothetical protein
VFATAKPARQVPEIALLAEGRGKSLRSPRVLHLGGLCGPEPGNGVGSAAADARPPSRFSSEVGTKADAKQQQRGFCAFRRLNAVQSQNGPRGLRAAEEVEESRFFG